LFQILKQADIFLKEASYCL